MLLTLTTPFHHRHPTCGALRGRFFIKRLFISKWRIPLYQLLPFHRLWTSKTKLQRSCTREYQEPSRPTLSFNEVHCWSNYFCLCEKHAFKIKSIWIDSQAILQFGRCVLKLSTWIFDSLGHPLWSFLCWSSSWPTNCWQLCSWMVYELNLLHNRLMLQSFECSFIKVLEGNSPKSLNGWKVKVNDHLCQSFISNSFDFVRFDLFSYQKLKIWLLISNFPTDCFRCLVGFLHFRRKCFDSRSFKGLWLIASD